MRGYQERKIRVNQKKWKEMKRNEKKWKKMTSDYVSIGNRYNEVNQNKSTQVIIIVMQ